MLYMFRAVSPPIIRSKPGTYQILCTVLELLMMGGETARNMYNIDNNKEYCVTLHLVGRS
jgi:hypothetical protein